MSLRLPLLLLALLPAGCAARFDAARATRPYPAALHRASSIDVQVFRDGTSIELVNATTRSFADFDLWLNQRFVRRIDALPAGRSRTISLDGFHDELGERFNPGGLLRSTRTSPLYMAEIQEGPDAPLVGLLVVRTGAEDE